MLVEHEYALDHSGQDGLHLCAVVREFGDPYPHRLRRGVERPRDGAGFIRAEVEGGPCEVARGVTCRQCRDGTHTLGELPRGESREEGGGSHATGESCGHGDPDALAPARRSPPEREDDEAQGDNDGDGRSDEDLGL